jgi:hypothetical protein
MKTDGEMDEILAEIRREHRATAAPGSLESALFAATELRREEGARNLRAAWAWGFALLLLAAIALSGVAWKIRSDHELEVRQAHHGVTPSVPAPRGPSESSPSSLRVETGAQAHAASFPLQRRSAHHAELHTTSLQRTERNSLQEFVPLPVSEGLPPAAQLSVVRVALTGSDLRQYGLQAPEDAQARTLLAEFVVGEDGLPRAIRIVR